MSGINLPPSLPPSGLPSSAAGKPVIDGAPVTTLPKTVLADAAARADLAGKVTAYNPRTQILTVSTSAGDIDIKTPTNLRQGLEVQVRIQRDGEGRPTASVYAQRPVRNTPEVLPAATPPREPSAATSPRDLPVLRAGDSVTASFVRETGGHTTAPPALPTLPQAAALIEQMRLKILGAQALADTTPDILQVLKTLATTDAPDQALLKLSPDIRQKVLETLTAIAGSSAPSAPMIAEGGEDAISALVRGGIGTMAKPVIATQNIGALLGMLLPMIENTEGTTIQKPEFSASASDNILKLDIIAIVEDGTEIRPAKTGEMIGRVESLTRDGAPVIRTADGIFVLKPTQTLPIGTQVLFNSRPVSVLDALATFIATGSSFKWPALEEAVKALGAQSPAAAQLLRNTIPAATAKFIPSSLFFMAALKTGNLSAWLGDTIIDALGRAGRKSLAERLAGDFSTLSKQSNSITSDWRGISIPLQHEDNISMMQFFVRHQPVTPVNPDQQGDTPVTPQRLTRFILNLNMAHMGAVQLDGLIQQRKMDMILRTADRLEPAIRNDIMQAYAKGLEQTGFEGGINFQVRAQSWVDIPAPEPLGRV